MRRTIKADENTKPKSAKATRGGSRGKSGKSKGGQMDVRPNADSLRSSQRSAATPASTKAKNGSTTGAARRGTGRRATSGKKKK